MNSKKKKIFVVILSILLAMSLLFLFVLIKKSSIQSNNDISDTNDVIIEEPTIKKQELRDVWLSNKAINDDYVGEIIFDSGLVNKSFVQAKSVYNPKTDDLYHFYKQNGSLVTDGTDLTGNDVYIWTNWKDMTYDYNILGGSIFMDYRNELLDQNIIIYGHHFSKESNNDPDRNKAFTPLELLMEKENYEKNKIVKLELDNETREYELVYVYIFDAFDENSFDNLQYFRTNYNFDSFLQVIDDGYYDKYIEAVENIKLYDTGLHLTNADRTLTLQTCVGGHAGELYEILVFREKCITLYND